MGALEHIATPSLVAKAIMDYTDHIMLVGEGARKFAIEMGFKPQNLLTDESRQMWLRWKANLNPDDNWLDHKGDVKIAFTHGTINMNAVKTAKPRLYIRTRPNMSPSRPRLTTSTAVTTRKPRIIQSR